MNELYNCGGIRLHSIAVKSKVTNDAQQQRGLKGAYRVVGVTRRARQAGHSHFG